MVTLFITAVTKAHEPASIDAYDRGPLGGSIFGFVGFRAQGLETDALIKPFQNPLRSHGRPCKTSNP